MCPDRGASMTMNYEDKTIPKPNQEWRERSPIMTFVWILAVVIGGPVFFVVGVLPMQFLNIPINGFVSAIPFFFAAGLIGGIVSGFIVGLYQRIVLRGLASLFSRRIPASVCGWAMGGALFLTLLDIRLDNCDSSKPVAINALRGGITNQSSICTRCTLLGLDSFQCGSCD